MTWQYRVYWLLQLYDNNTYDCAYHFCDISIVLFTKPRIELIQLFKTTFYCLL